jgi:DASS family divalent anion:Na+ symporter
MFVLFGVLWFVPPPWDVGEQAWRLFACFIVAIIAVVISAVPILVTAVIAVTVAIFTGLMTPEVAYSGFGQGFIVLIVVAFLVATAVVKSGLGIRVAHHLIKRFGTSTLRLGYCMVAVDAMIAPAFPSNTARSGVLYPITLSLAKGGGSNPDEGTRKKMGAYLMTNGLFGLSISSTLWFTGMAANPVGAGMAAELGVQITFASWLLASCVPALVALVCVPLVLYKLFPPEVSETPDAPRHSAEELERIGPMSRDEKITAVTFVLLVVFWALADFIGVDKTAVAFLGLAILMIANIFTLDDLAGQGAALGIFVWFAILYTMSSQLNELGFMAAVGNQLSSNLAGLPWPAVYVSIIVLYVLLHYLFVSQTAQMLALFSVFLGVGINAGVPGELMALMLLFATNFFSAITPQGSSANVLMVGSGYLTMDELYKRGVVITACNLFIFLTVGTAWILLVS